MNLKEAVEKACEQPTLLDSLNWIAAWETERVVKQVRDFDRTGISTTSHGGGWDTYFRICFEEIMKERMRLQLASNNALLNINQVNSDD